MLRLLSHTAMALLALQATATAAVAAATLCANSSLLAPSVATLMVSPSNASEAVVLYPNCSLEIIVPTFVPNEYNKIAGPLTMLNCSEKEIDAMISFPPVNILYIDSTSIKSFDFSNHSEVLELMLSWNNIYTLNDFIFPPKLRKLDLEKNFFTEIPKGKIPDKVTTLILDRNGFKTLANVSLPENLEDLFLYGSQLVAVNFTLLPPHLKAIHLDDSSFPTLERMLFPDSLEVFECIDFKSEIFRGVRLSPDLRTLDLDGNSFTEFEIRESDREILLNLEVYNIETNLAACPEPSAKKERLRDTFDVCMISDELFASKYETPTKETPPTSKTPVVVGSVVGGLAILLISAIVYAVVVKNKRSQQAKSAEDSTTGYTAHIQGGSASTAHSSNDAGYLSNDIRNDEAIIPFRIAQDEIQTSRKISKGGFGIIFLGKFRGRHVAVKQLLPEKARDNALIKSFMDEIRRCARLEHPKIVEFIGVTWSTLLDLAVVLEYMAGGDLRAALHTESRLSKPGDWFEPSCNLKARTGLALDIVEALVYLHSFETSIIHRDITARTVLLSEDGDAKLSDFGISREVAIDETMTAEIGTVAWIAPEVMQGERYSEKADIYSLGVLLTELDTCSLPYRVELEAQDGREAGVKAAGHRNARIAVLVSTGALKPSLSASCPADVSELVMRCLSFSPQERPSAIEIHYALRKILHSAQPLAGSFV